MNALPANAGEIIDHWRRVAPGREALRHGERSWTWAQLADRVGRNAAAQAAAGLRAGDRVAVLDKSNPVQVETVLACLQAGTVMTPVNFMFAADQVRHVISDARARLLLVGAEFRQVAEAIAAEIPSVEQVVIVGGGEDEYEQWLAAASPATRLPRPGADACFGQFYTSGTTGFPKGAMLSGANATAIAVAFAALAGFDADSAFLAGTGVYHLATMSLQIGALYRGGRVVAPRDTGPGALLDEIAAWRITHAFVATPLLSAILEVPGVADRDYRHLKEILYGAAPITPPVLRRCLETFPVQLVQGYGATEAGAICGLLDRDHRDPGHLERLASVGRPLPGVELDIADLATGEPLGPRQTGEVRVRSGQVMLGYWDGTGPDTSAITPDGWLRTGDAGYLDEDGYLYLTGRLKDMYLNDGHNVYAAVVERVLATHPQVAEAAVIGVPDGRRGEVGMAFLLPVAEEGINESDVLRHCRAHLADYQCPESLVTVSAFPRNALGKVVRNDLRSG